MNDIWESRPENLSPHELVAWALTEVASAIHEHCFWMGNVEISDALKGLADAVQERLPHNRNRD